MNNIWYNFAVLSVAPLGHGCYTGHRAGRNVTVKMKVLTSHLALWSGRAHVGEEEEKSPG